MQNHRYSGVLNFKDVADHWIGYPKSPYTSFTVTESPSTTHTTPATSAPVRTTKKSKKKKHKKTSNSKRRYDIDEYSDYKETQRSREKYTYDDFDYDYDGPINTPYGGNVYAPSPFIIRSSASMPKVEMVKPSARSNSQMIKAIYAGTPKVATYVIPNAKKYVVQRVKSELVYAPPASIPPSPAMYAAASNSGMRRLDPLDYDDNPGGSFLGPQDSFPPRPVMNKITQPGQRQPCHGPECHQHHKGLVRFYWRRVVYPPNSRGRARRPGGRTRRRFRDGGRSPSDQKDVFIRDEEEEDEEDDPRHNGKEDGNDNDDTDDGDEEDEDNEESNTGRRNKWQPGKAYGHDLNEGSNYDSQDIKTYRDKRYAYRNYRKRRRGVF